MWSLGHWGVAISFDKDPCTPWGQKQKHLRGKHAEEKTSKAASHKIICFKIFMYHPFAQGFAFELQSSSCLLSNIRILVSLETIQLAPRSMSNCNSGKCPCHAAWQNCNNKRQKFFQRLEQTRRFIAEPGESHQKTWNSVLEVLKRAENLKKLTTPEKNERIWMSPFCNL